jgi:hypothetical protein
MAEVGRVSIRVPSSIKQGEVIRVRTLVIHPMEIVERDKQGKIISKNYNYSLYGSVVQWQRDLARGDHPGCQPESQL